MSDLNIQPGNIVNVPERPSITKWQLVYAGWTLLIVAQRLMVRVWDAMGEAGSQANEEVISE